MEVTQGGRREFLHSVKYGGSGNSGCNRSSESLVKRLIICNWKANQADAMEEDAMNTQGTSAGCDGNQTEEDCFQSAGVGLSHDRCRTNRCQAHARRDLRKREQQ